MERMTTRDFDGVPILLHDKGYAALLDRLAAYEDTGLDPEVCAEYKKFEDEAVSKNVLFSRIVELMDAESEGRLLVLPCKVGDIVYRISRHRVDVTGYRMEWEWETYVEAVRFTAGMTGAIGKTVFRTREEAEAALEKERDV